jgi:methionine-rich copper-binding protein CopC
VSILRLIGTALVAVLIALGGGPAWAHADLVSTEPDYGAALPSAPGRALLRFNYPVELDGAVFELGGRSRAVGRPAYAAPDHKEVSVPLARLGTGDHVLSWFLFTKDGHVMGGELAFTVRPGAVDGVTPSPRRRSFSRLSIAASMLAATAVLVGQPPPT